MGILLCCNGFSISKLFTYQIFFIVRGNDLIFHLLTLFLNYRNQIIHAFFKVITETPLLPGVHYTMMDLAEPPGVL